MSTGLQCATHPLLRRPTGALCGLIARLSIDERLVAIEVAAARAGGEQAARAMTRTMDRVGFACRADQVGAILAEELRQLRGDAAGAPPSCPGEAGPVVG
jgi:hypothetical protein